MISFVSCAARLYASTIFPESADLLAELRALDGGHWSPEIVEEVYPGYYYQRPEAKLYGGAEAFRALLHHEVFAATNEARHSGPASLLVAFNGASICGSVIYSGTAPELKAVWETQRPPDRHTLRALPTDELLSRPREVIDVSDGPHLYLGSAGSHNYGHWLVEDLPRLAAVETLRRLYPGRPITILLPDIEAHRGIADVKLQSIRSFLGRELMAADGGVRVHDVAYDRVQQLDRLYYVTPVSYHPFIRSPAAMQRLAGIASAAAAPMRTRVKQVDKLFVLRSAGMSRGLRNAEAVNALLSAHGYEVVDLSRQPFDVQVAMFANARRIIGCMGAAMTNSLFMAPGSTIGYLAPEGWIEPFYWDLAGARGQDVAICYGPTLEPDRPAHASAYTIDPAVLTEMIDEIDA